MLFMGAKPGKKKILPERYSGIQSHWRLTQILLMQVSAGNACAYSGNMDGSRKLLIANYNIRDRMNTLNQIYASWAYSLAFEAPEVNIKYLKQLQQMDDQWPKPSFELGVIYNLTGQYYNAITEFQKHLTIYRRWGSRIQEQFSLGGTRYCLS